MIRYIQQPSVITSAGNKPKRIEEFFGRVNSATDLISIARMKSPPGWIEPAQKPDFDEYTVVLSGMLRVTSAEGVYDVRAGECILIGKGERIEYSTPEASGAEYIAVCLPAFSPGSVHREA